MSETQGSDVDSSTSSDIVDSVSQNLRSAESFTILIHGVGAEAPDDLLLAAEEGYRASGFGNNTVIQRTLSECPALSQEKGAEAILIKGQKGGHFVIALPWNNRIRLALLAEFCLMALLLLMTMIAAASWSGLLSEAIIHRSIGGSLVVIVFLFAQWAFAWWAPWLWVVACFLIVVLSVIASRIAIRCIPSAQTTGWRLILALLFFVVAFISLDSVRTIWFASKDIPSDNLYKPELADLPPIEVLYEIKSRNAAAAAVTINTSRVLPEATQDNLQVKGEDSPRPWPNVGKQSPQPPEQASANRIDEEQIHPDIRKQSDTKPKVRSDFVTCLFFLLICVGVIVLTVILGYFLDFGLDVLDYGGDENHNTIMFGRLGDAIRWLHSQAPNAHLTVVAHSLGSVIASQALSSMSDSEPLLSQITLITLGSPLNYLYQVFPNVVNTPRKLSAAICSKARWINLWRKSDKIGKELDVEPGVLVQYCIGKGGHRNYWEDGAVWKAVVYESLKIGNFKGNVSPPGHPARCFLEAHLSLIAILSIVSLLFLGIALWYHPNPIYWLPTFAKAVPHYGARH